MENTDKTIMEDKEPWGRFEHSHNPMGKVFAGFAVLTAGALLFASKLGAPIPYWVFTWPVLLIVIGLYVGVKHSFRHFSWVILVLVGGVFLADKVVLDFSLAAYIWPIMIMLGGLFIIFKPKRKFKDKKWRNKWEEFHSAYQTKGSSEDYIDSVSVFSGVKKNIISKDFKGGEVSNTFGGTELNFSNADINGKVILDISQVFGGTVLIIPPHWELQSELVAIMGGIEDKRQITSNLNVDGSKVLILKGTTIFGGIEIRSF